MARVAISFSTKDRVELSQRAIVPLRQPDKFDLFVNDGSVTDEGKEFARSLHGAVVTEGVRGGPDAAIVYALTSMLLHTNNYEFIALVENDVLLSPDWFEPTMALFERGTKDGLYVGAVSARCYADRILCQRDGYALMHNLGAGMVIFSRRAAWAVLNEFRTGWTLENRQLFMQMSGLDIGQWWAFKMNDHPLCADWGFDRVLASHGLASLALTPSPVEMIGQVPSLAEQGLELAREPIYSMLDDKAFDRFRQTAARIVRRKVWPGTWGICPQLPDGSQIIFPHQVHRIDGASPGPWKLRWAQGFGPFAWEAKEAGAAITVPVSGPANFIVGNPDRCKVVDTVSGYEVAPTGTIAEGQQVVLGVPAGVSYRKITLRATAPGAIFYGLQVIQPQMEILPALFDHNILPPTE